MSHDKKHLIYVIDDNPMNLLLTSKILESYGFETQTAESGAAALQLIRQQRPSLILLDISMPNMDGYEVCRRIKAKEDWADIPVIFLTANTQTENLVEGFNVGGVDYITKPFRREELWVRVSTHLELAESRRTIIEMNRSRDRLYSIIAHDIRSPLSGILQTLEAINQGYIGLEGEELREIIKLLGERTKETSTLLNSLLQWTRIQTDSQQLEFKATDLFVLIQSCVDLLRPNAEQKELSIEVEVEEELRAWCDELSIHTVVRNLLSNAIKFTPRGGRVRIGAGKKDGQAMIYVADNGVGMDSETVERIFAKDQHFTSSGTENEQGTGLGLMLVKDFVKKNNGSLQVDSEPGEGTEFRVYLPLNN